MPVTRRSINCRVSSRSGARCRYVNNNWPSRMRGYSGAIGSLTFTIISALAQTSSAESIMVAPARSYSALSKPEPPPASVSTMISWPASLSARTPAGVSPTLYSLSLISLGRPTIKIHSPDTYVLRKHGLLGRFDVDLRALKLAAEVNVNGLPFRENIQHLRSGFAMPVAGRLRAAKRKMNFGADG